MEAARKEKLVITLDIRCDRVPFGERLIKIPSALQESRELRSAIEAAIDSVTAPHEPLIRLRIKRANAEVHEDWP